MGNVMLRGEPTSLDETPMRMKAGLAYKSGRREEGRLEGDPVAACICGSVIVMA